MAIEKVTAGRDALGDFAPKFAELNDDVLFGQVWSREEALPPRDRSIVTVTALASMGITDSSLEYHLKTAKKNGITRDEIAEILTHLAFYSVTFAPGCRNNWHIHTAAKGGGQILLVTGGWGWYQEWGKPARALRAGDVVQIPAGVKHWHGAARDSWFAHLAVEVPGEGTGNQWLEPVDGEYGALE